MITTLYNRYIKITRYRIRMTNIIPVCWCILKCIIVSVQHATKLSLYSSIHILFTYASNLGKPSESLSLPNNCTISSSVSAITVIFHSDMSKSTFYLVSKIFLHWPRYFFLICYLHKKGQETWNIFFTAFTSAKSLSVTITDSINRSGIRVFRLSRHKLKLSSCSIFKYAKATEKVISILVTPTISVNGNRYMLGLYVQSIINVREMHVITQC